MSVSYPCPFDAQHPNHYQQRGLWWWWQWFPCHGQLSLNWADMLAHPTAQTLDRTFPSIMPALTCSSFFSSSGPQYWIYDGERRVSGPAPITELGLSTSPVQAALMWGTEKNKIYFFKGGNYWRFNPSARQVDNVYPRTMADWRGIPQEIDAAFQDETGEYRKEETHIPACVFSPSPASSVGRESAGFGV